jgi:hypothetical protein
MRSCSSGWRTATILNSFDYQTGNAIWARAGFEFPLWRSSLFMLFFGVIVLKRQYSEEVNQLWHYWTNRFFGRRE